MMKWLFIAANVSVTKILQAVLACNSPRFAQEELQLRPESKDSGDMPTCCWVHAGGLREGSHQQ